MSSDPMSGDETRTGIIAWFARNNVAANLLMFTILVAGIYSAFTIRKQTTPDFEPNTIRVSVDFPGAAPQEVEEGIVIKIEEAVQDVGGVKEIDGAAREGRGTVTLELETEADLDQVLAEVKTRVDSINTFPELAERPVIERFEFTFPVIFTSIYGELDDYARKELGEQIKTELLALPGINDIEVYGDRDYEISIEVTEETLRQYGLTMTEIATALRAQSLDIPGGTIETDGGDILLRTQGQVYTGKDFGDLTIRTFPDGTRLRLRDIATVIDGFVDNDGYSRYLRAPVVTMNVLASGQENELETAEMVKAHMARVERRMPEGVNVDVWVDRSSYLQQRLDLMQRNMLQGALLVFLVLTLFLRLKFAFWVIVGIPVTFCGALALMPINPFPVTINMISLFGFILVLGIVVDDAIIIGESIYTEVREKGHSTASVVDGAHRVAVAATFGVLTTIAAFAPMLTVGGFGGPFLTAVSVVVSLCLLFSLVESKLILPAHLAHSKITPINEEEIFSPYSSVAFWRWPNKFLERAQRRTQHRLQWVIERVYTPIIERAVAARGVTVAGFFALLIITFGLFNGGLVRFVFFPNIPGEFVQMDLTMQNGIPTAERNAALEKIEAAVYRARDDYMASTPGAMDPLKNVAVFTRGKSDGVMIVEMPPAELQTLSLEGLTNRWRREVGEIPGARVLKFSASNPLGGGQPLSFSFQGNNYDALEAAAGELATALEDYEGVFDILNTAAPAGDEIRLAVKPEAEALGLTLTSLGTQVRQAFFGEEVQRIQRGTDELKVMLRYPEAQRRSVNDLERMLITTPDGDRVPFSDVAEVNFGDAYSVINRLDGKRTVTVSADVDFAVAEPRRIIGEVAADVIPGIVSKYPGVSYGLSGSSQEEVEAIVEVGVAGLGALLLIYALIAIPLKSYLQPLIIMSVIPFGFVGAVVGHIVMGQAISLFSVFGLIALAGVVVNDSLIMIDFVNKARAAGLSPQEAVVQSGRARFRAIVLTSLTTAAGLVPILMEKSTQAQFLIPMAISMSFGIVFATVITLILVPCLYLLLMDVRRRGGQIKRWFLGDSPAYRASEG